MTTDMNIALERQNSMLMFIKVEWKIKIFEFEKIVLIDGPKYHMKYFYHNFELLHPLVAMQFYRTCLNKLLMPYLTNRIC